MRFTALPGFEGAAWAALLLVGLVSACAPEIGDDCANALDCSASGTRLCDRTQPGGYCTVAGCEESTCPDEAVCVQFGRLIDETPVDRLSRTFCMLKCESKGDCRGEEGYDCFEANRFGGTAEARVLGGAKAKFCAPLPPTGTASRPRDAGTPEDASMSTPEDDAGTLDAGEDAMMSLPEDDGGTI